MRAERGRISCQRATPLPGDPLIVKRVTTLVQHGHDRGQRVGGIDARGEPGVAGPEAHGHRVSRPSHEPAVLVEPDVARHVEGKRHLGLVGPRAVGKGGATGPGKSLDDRGYPRREVVEHRSQHGEGRPGLVEVDQRVVPVATGCEQIRLPAGEGDQGPDAIQPGVHISRLACIRPDRHGA